MVRGAGGKGGEVEVTISVALVSSRLAVDKCCH